MSIRSRVNSCNAWLDEDRINVRQVIKLVGCVSFVVAGAITIFVAWNASALIAKANNDLENERSRVAILEGQKEECFADLKALTEKGEIIQTLKFYPFSE